MLKLYYKHKHNEDVFDFVMWISSVIRHGDPNKQDYVHV